ncbi:17809_t:CDS:2 [Cetraspora pellucida]|uniref:17809_t:CDS:1 n=1 Tax=Cetraspora pellucida TaxID=1433469 RepID=A0ACA9MCE8_9GLOM|nr:17809_t:CDS:2 [Cetraspora pellucida]
MGIKSVGHDLFPAVNEIMLKYLTPHILSAEHMEMAQCLYFNVNKMDSNILDNYNEDVDIDLTDGFIEDMYNTKQILLKSMINEVVVDSILYLCSCMFNISRDIVCYHYFQVMMISTVAGFQIQMIPSRWYINNKQDKSVVAEACCFVNQEAMQNFSCTVITPNPLTTSKTVTTVLRCAAKKKKKYGEIWELARQAAQISVDYDKSDEIIGRLKQFISQNKEIIVTSTGSVRNHDLLKSSEIQVDNNEENELKRVENLLVLRLKGVRKQNGINYQQKKNHAQSILAVHVKN